MKCAFEKFTCPRGFIPSCKIGTQTPVVFSNGRIEPDSLLKE